MELTGGGWRESLDEEGHYEFTMQQPPFELVMAVRVWATGKDSNIVDEEGDPEMRFGDFADRWNFLPPAMQREIYERGVCAANPSWKFIPKPQGLRKTEDSDAW